MDENPYKAPGAVSEPAPKRPVSALRIFVLSGMLASLAGAAFSLFGICFISTKIIGRADLTVTLQERDGLIMFTAGAVCLSAAAWALWFNRAYTGAAIAIAAVVLAWFFGP
ncbi:MAG TPA: hypothetical protein VHC19_16430 [Pirellulales bacterium]|nr:hypothetical protein [Pirellulales bacterium]